nr:MAG TPA: hypothetical protein [Siphoviridae sp. ctgbm9]
MEHFLCSLLNGLRYIGIAPCVHYNGVCVLSQVGIEQRVAMPSFLGINPTLY